MRKQEALEQLKSLNPDSFVTYGEGDLGIPLKISDAIADFESLDEYEDSDFAFEECNENGKILSGDEMDISASDIVIKKNPRSDCIAEEDIHIFIKGDDGKLLSPQEIIDKLNEVCRNI